MDVIAGGSVSIHPVRVPAGQPNYVVRLVRLSTGAELARRVYGPATPSPIDASEDGTLVLEGQGADTFALRNIVTGAISGTVHASVRGLLGNHLVIVQGDQLSPPTGPVPHSVIDLLTGRTVWSGTFDLRSVIEYPGNGGLALAVDPGGHPGGCPAWARVEIADLATGMTRDSTLDTCAQR